MKCKVIEKTLQSVSDGKYEMVFVLKCYMLRGLSLGGNMGYTVGKLDTQSSFFSHETNTNMALWIASWNQ